MGSKNAFVVVVDESWYQDYLPFYLHFCHRAYPEAEIFLFIVGKLQPSIKLSLKDNSYRVHIVEDFGKDGATNPNNVKTLRWTILADQLPGIQYAYIGDIDIMIAKEQEDLFENHKLHAQTIGASFSNIIRPGAPRLSGLHFIDVVPYTNAVRAGVRELRETLKQPIKIRNELLLYDLVKNSEILPKSLGWLCGVGGPQTPQYRPMHGVHLGQFRGDNTTYNSASKEEEQAYFKDFVKAFEESKELRRLIDVVHERVKLTIVRALEYGQKFGG